VSLRGVVLGRVHAEALWAVHLHLLILSSFCRACAVRSHCGGATSARGKPGKTLNRSGQTDASWDRNESGSSGSGCLRSANNSTRQPYTCGGFANYGQLFHGRLATLCANAATSAMRPFYASDLIADAGRRTMAAGWQLGLDPGCMGACRFGRSGPQPLECAQTAEKVLY